MPSPVSPITDDYVGGKGRLYFQADGAGRMEEVGDVDDFIISQEAERLERFSNQYAVRTKTYSKVQQLSATISFTAVQNTARNMALAMMSDKTFLTQASATGEVKVQNSIRAGDVIDLEALDVTVNHIRGGGEATGAYPTGAYEVDSRSGLVKILFIPTGATSYTGADINYDVAEITGSAGRLNIGGASNPDLEGKLIFISLNDAGEPKEKCIVHRAQMGPNGDINLISDDTRNLPIQGEVIADTTQPAGHELYTLIDLEPRTNRGEADA